MPGNPKKRKKKVKNRKQAGKKERLFELSAEQNEKLQNQKKEERAHKIFINEIIFMFSGLVTGTFGMFGLQSNYVNASVLTLIIILSTIPLSELVIYKVKQYSKRFNYVPDMLLDRFIVYLGVIGICAALVININNAFSGYSHTVYAELTFKTNNKKQSRNSAYTDYKLYVEHNNKELELNCSCDMWYDLEIGDKVPIRYHSGFLGADFIKTE
ncbi:MAG: hypothetical protein N4A72_02475 [Bacteroidales bacterium]|jgi:cation transport ATPase|nr:hypothetical protein [Bacteroidales bacterium]